MSKKITLDDMKQMQETGLLKNICNVGILPEQVFFIKQLVNSGKYKSINKFVQDAVSDKLDAKGGNSE